MLTPKEIVKRHFDLLARERDKWWRNNKYYYNDLERFLKFLIPKNVSVLEIGCSTGNLLFALEPSDGVGIDISSRSVEIASVKYPQYTFLTMDAEDLNLQNKFDFIVMSDLIGLLGDTQTAFKNLHKVSHNGTRVIITYYNHLWSPILKLAEKLKLKMSEPAQSWLSPRDIENLLGLEGFEVIKRGQRFLLPKYLPLISNFCNIYLNKLPVFRKLSLINYFVARPVLKNFQEYSVSVIVPARNEKGNIENIVKRVPFLGKHTELIFVEGHSYDGTLAEMWRIKNLYPDKDIKILIQDGKGKGDAVRKGFEAAKGEILMILDADLTVPPEDLPKFYEAIFFNKGEFINGSRLVYPMGGQAMRFANLLGNKFFSLAFTWLLDQPLKDTLCGTKVLFKKDYKKIKRNRSYFGNFDPFGDFDLLFGAAKLNLKIVEIPIRYQDRVYGATQISRWKHGWLLLKMCFFAMRKIKFI